MRSRTILAALGAAFLSVVPAAASAQTTDNATTYTTEREDDDRFPWGLLGLLGLAGLIPRKRHVDVNVDNRTHR